MWQPPNCKSLTGSRVTMGTGGKEPEALLQDEFDIVELSEPRHLVGVDLFTIGKNAVDFLRSANLNGRIAA